MPRHAWVHSGFVFDAASVAAVYFSSADLPPPLVSHASSSSGAPLNWASADFTWHLPTAPRSLLRFLATASAHCSLPLEAGLVSTVPASSPPESTAVPGSQ